MITRRDRLAETLCRSGAMRLVELLPGRPQLLVVNYHRIGRQEDTRLDRQVFSTDEEGLEQQIRILRRKADILHPEEAFGLIERGLPLKRPAVLLTFDDGYLDNYTRAVPVLEACRAPAVFFLVTSYLENPHQVPWWDRIAFLARCCIGRTIEMRVPRTFVRVMTEEDADEVIAELLGIFRGEVQDEAAFMAELEANAGGADVAGEGRLFMTWAEAREAQDHGITIGLHTHSHHILSRLDEAGQRRELADSRALMTERLGLDCRVLAYPVGTPTAFGPATKRIAREEGYRCAFAFAGGTNSPGAVDPFEVRRVSLPAYATPARSRTAVSLMSLTRQVWY
jgi:peptidoglycan/xylan/chitin deacetylase (PgdA/CDA1 family)